MNLATVHAGWSDWQIQAEQPPDGIKKNSISETQLTFQLSEFVPFANDGFSFIYDPVNDSKSAVDNYIYTSLTFSHLRFWPMLKHTVNGVIT